MKHLVPLARAKKRGWEALAAALAAHGLSSRQVGTLTTAWTGATEAGRKLILDDPHLVLRAEEQAKRPKEKSGGERLLSDVAAIGAIARRAKRTAEEERAREARWSFTAELQRAAIAAEADAAALFALVKTEVASAG